MESIIELTHISKEFYGKQYTVNAVTNASLCIHKGQSIAIIGPSGCGKTTLLNIIGLAIKPNDGKLILEGIDTKELTAKQKAEIRNSFFGYVVQDFLLLNDYTVFENIDLPFVYSNKKKSRNEKNEIINSILKDLHITDKIHQKVSELSGGQKQRIAIARALVNNPKVILADEPTGALDEATGNEIINILLSQVKAGKSLVLVTHNTEIAKKCDVIYKMNDGTLEEYYCNSNSEIS